MSDKIPETRINTEDHKDSDDKNSGIGSDGSRSINHNTENNATKKDRPQNKNLISLASRTREERIEIGRKGGIKSGESRKAKKTMRDSLIAMLSKELTPRQLEKMGIDTETLDDYTIQGALLTAMLREAINGDTKAMQLVRDTIGEAPTQKAEIKNEVITREDLSAIDNLRKYLTS